MSVINYSQVTGVGGDSSVLSYANAGLFPVTGAEGIIYIDKANADMYLWTGAVYELQGGSSTPYVGFWSQFPSANFLNYFIDEWDCPITGVGNFSGSLYAVSSGASAAIQPRDVSEANAGINSTEKAIGVTSLNPGTSSTGRAALGFGGAQGAASYRIGILEMIYGIRQNIWVLGTVSENYQVWTGFMDIITAQPTNGVYFRYNYNVNGGRWEYCTTVAGVTTAADTGVAPVAGVYQVMEIKVNAAGTSVTFYIDGTLVGTISSGLPTNAGLLAMSSVLRSAGTGLGGSGLVGIDALYMATERLAVR